MNFIHILDKKISLNFCKLAWSWSVIQLLQVFFHHSFNPKKSPSMQKSTMFLFCKSVLQCHILHIQWNPYQILQNSTSMESLFHMWSITDDSDGTVEVWNLPFFKLYSLETFSHANNIKCRSSNSFNFFLVLCWLLGLTQDSNWNNAFCTHCYF